jgi:hypothetical protein
MIDALELTFSFKSTFDIHQNHSLTKIFTKIWEFTLHICKAFNIKKFLENTANSVYQNRKYSLPK